MATHPQYDNARKRKLREERDNRSIVPLDSTDEVAAVKLSGGATTDLRKTAVGSRFSGRHIFLIASVQRLQLYPPKPDVERLDPAPNSDGQGHGSDEIDPLPFIKLEPVEENISISHYTHVPFTDNANDALNYPAQIAGQLEPTLDRRERELDWRSGEVDRRERELERRERELERRERELDRRERAFEDEKTRWAVIQKTTRDGAPHWQNAIDVLQNQIQIDFLAERKETRDREAALEAKIMKQIDDKLDKDRRPKEDLFKPWK
jgi:hypothetical protein